MKKRILILDDDEAVLEILQILMDYEGMEATIVEETNDLFALIRLHRPHLILLDYSLKGTNGGEWCHLLKNTPQFSDIPVMLFTAHSEKHIQKGTYGCDDFIAKPFEIEEIVLKIKTLIEAAPAAYTAEQTSKKRKRESAE